MARSTTLLGAWLAMNARLAQDSARVVAARTAMMLDPRLHGSRRLAKEMHLMTAEKMQAAWLGVAEAQRAFGALALEAAFGRVRPSHEAAHKVVTASLKPARRKARANARRLAGG